MIQFNPDACIGCSRCLQDCFPHALSMEDGRPSLTYPEFCLRCGHCIAVCPTGAVTDDELDMAESVPVGSHLKPEELLLQMKSRRSCRHYKATPVPKEVLLQLVNAARACPTAKNLQDIRFISVTGQISALLDATLETLGEVGRTQAQTATDPNELRRANNFISWYRQRSSDASFDPLFFHAPQLLIFVSSAESARDTAAAAAYAELMAYACGLGALYSGYFTACADSPRIRQLLQLAEHEHAIRCLVLGYPDIHFRRTVPRNPVNLTEL